MSSKLQLKSSDCMSTIKLLLHGLSSHLNTLLGDAYAIFYLYAPCTRKDGWDASLHEQVVRQRHMHRWLCTLRHRITE